MSATKTDAFILKTRDYRDTSILAHFYTREFGKIHGIIKGVRDARGRYGSTLEPFSLNEILFYRRRRGASDLHQVTSVELIELFGDIRQDMSRLSTACYLIELLDEIVEPEEPSMVTFDLLKDSLTFLSRGHSPKRCARIFESKLLLELGLLPELKECVVCRKVPEEAFFSANLGGIHCRGCSSGARTASNEGSVFLSQGALKFLDHVLRSPTDELYGVKVSQEVGQEIERALRRFIDAHLQKKLQTVIFMDKMGQ